MGAKKIAIFAIIMDDPDAFQVVGYTWVHWSVFNISVFDTSVAEGEEIGGASIIGRNDADSNDYYGPCPPPGPAHTYVTSVYALSEMVPAHIADSPLTRIEFESEYSPLILAKGTIISEYESN